MGERVAPDIIRQLYVATWRSVCSAITSHHTSVLLLAGERPRVSSQAGCGCVWRICYGLAKLFFFVLQYPEDTAMSGNETAPPAAIRRSASVKALCRQCVFFFLCRSNKPMVCLACFSCGPLLVTEGYLRCQTRFCCCFHIPASIGCVMRSSAITPFGPAPIW